MHEWAFSVGEGQGPFIEISTSKFLGNETRDGLYFKIGQQKVFVPKEDCLWLSQEINSYF